KVLKYYTLTLTLKVLKYYTLTLTLKVLKYYTLTLTLKVLKYYTLTLTLKFKVKVPPLDSTQADCRMRKLEWDYVLCESFGFRNLEIHVPFYAHVWNRVEVEPTKPVQMFIAVKNDLVVGECHITLAIGIPCLFNVTTLKNGRSKGIGKAVALAAMVSARESNYCYMVLQASDMSVSIYKKLDFKSISLYKTFVKIVAAVLQNNQNVTGNVWQFSIHNDLYILFENYRRIF
ncbi:unnamed protein product, partial [Rotaria sp. Silwood2]